MLLSRRSKIEEGERITHPNRRFYGEQICLLEDIFTPQSEKRVENTSEAIVMKVMRQTSSPKTQKGPLIQHALLVWLHVHKLNVFNLLPKICGPSLGMG